MSGMREKELREAAICVVCRKPFGASGIPLFYRVRVQRFGVDVPAVQRQAGLEMQLGGAVALAQVMGPNEELAKELTSVEFTVCEPCSLDFDRGSMPIAILAEMASEARDRLTKTVGDACS